MFAILQVTSVLLCGTLLWWGYPKQPMPLKGKERIGSRRRMARNAMSRASRQLDDSAGPS
jgi:hypothetical protein